jgi:hypothetical protein
MESLLHQAKRLPADKLEWKPMEEGRSALSQVQECAVIAGFYPHLFQTLQMPNLDEAAMKQFGEATAALDTLEKAETELRKNTATVAEAIRNMADDKLGQEMKFFGPDMWKVSSVLNAHCWNLQYHTGQICYIQTLLGDKEMG